MGKKRTDESEDAASPPPDAAAPEALDRRSPEQDRACRAHGAACEAAQAFGAGLSAALGWEAVAYADSDEDDDPIKRRFDILAAFVRAHPAAPPEALYRYGAAQGMHTRDADAWAMQPAWLRAAFETFGVVLRLLDRLAAEEAARAALPAPDAPAPRAAALALPEDQTTLARLPDPLALRDDLTPRLTRAADDGA